VALIAIPAPTLCNANVFFGSVVIVRADSGSMTPPGRTGRSSGLKLSTRTVYQGATAHSI
jgi:hypothetical protein